MWFFGTPNTPGPAKFIIFGAGIAAGAGAAWALDKTLVGPEKAKTLREQGTSVLDSRQAEVYAMALPFATAAGIALGMQRRTPTSGLTTSAQIAAAALLSTVAGAVINADSDKAGDYVTGIGVMSAATGAGILMGVRDEIAMGVARNVGLGLFGLAIGVAAPTVIRTLSGIPGNIKRGIEHAE
jgi:hypothetical protein